MHCCGPSRGHGQFMDETHLQHTNQRQTATPCGQYSAIAGATLTL